MEQPVQVLKAVQKLFLSLYDLMIPILVLIVSAIGSMIYTGYLNGGTNVIEAFSNCICREAFATEEISYEQAITYLRKEAITLPVTAPRGYVLLTYRHIPLGFVKNIGNRANNLYPQEWRIRSGYLPENIRILSEYVTD